MIKLILNSTLFLFLTFISASAEMPTITIASTTSTDNSGFSNYILPKFKKIKGIRIRIHDKPLKQLKMAMLMYY